MTWVTTIWGEGEQLDILQMSVRAFVMFFIMLALIRLGGMRIFGKKSAFDTIVIIMLGAILARGVVGASPFFSTVAAATVLVVTDRFLAWLSERNKTINNLLKGKHLLLYKDGHIIRRNMRKASLSQSDLLESLRLETKCADFDKVDKVYMETNGRLSFIMKAT
ncbi:DUF421 domain-containing protein [Chitinophaga solisilvae]|uniref:DUF421 domain-containing protein n=1 Tax=Chitinophaga solisilvae TaxID=1233460 RepID=UPI0013690254|nr:YetF domain-containing protein [Chitinophaga solisilvae]